MPETEHDHDADRVIEIARTAIDQEFAIAERLDAKSRSLMTLAGSWFAVAQAVAGATLGAKGVAHGWLYAVAILAGLGALVLAATLWRGSRIWALRQEVDIVPETLFAMRERARVAEGDFSDDLLRHYAAILQSRRMTNLDRVAHTRKAERLWAVAVLFPLLELVVALCGRLFG